MSENKVDEIRPSHYGGEENPFEPIKIIDYYNLGFNNGNAIKYILRAGKKRNTPELTDLKKAIQYLSWQVAKLERDENTISKG